MATSSKAKVRRKPGADSFLLPIRVRPLGNGRFLGRCAALPGLLVEGASVDEVLRLAPLVARDLIKAMRQKGVPLPPRLHAATLPMSVHLLVAA